jgi:hypothetical protein
MTSFRRALLSAAPLLAVSPASAAVLTIQDGSNTSRSFFYFQDGSSNYFPATGIYGVTGDNQADVNSTHQLLVLASPSGTWTVTGAGGTFPITASALPLPTGAATAALQAAINGDGGGLAHVTNFPATQPISASALPLPTGAATAASQPTAATLGSTTSGQTGNLEMAATVSSAPTLTAGQTNPLYTDTAGNLRVNVVAGGGSGGTSSSFGAAFPSTGTAAGAEYLSAAPTLANGQQVALQTDLNGNLKVNLVAGGGSGGTALSDSSAFTTGSTSITPVGGVVGASALTSGHTGAVAMDTGRNMFANVNEWAGFSLGAPSNYGTSPGAVAVPGVNAFITNTPTIGNTGFTAAGVSGVNSAYSENPLAGGGEALTAEPGTLATTGQKVADFRDKSGKEITLPFAPRELMWRGTVSATTTAAATIANSSNTTLKSYMTGLQCSRGDAGTTAITVTLNDTASTVFVLPNSGGGGGYTATFQTPLVTSAVNTSFTFTEGAATATVYCNAQGFFGY